MEKKINNVRRKKVKKQKDNTKYSQKNIRPKEIQVI